MRATISLLKKDITVRAALFSSGIIGPVCWEETVNSSLYIEILHQFVAISKTLSDLQTDWFFARPHQIAYVFAFLHVYFGNCAIAFLYRNTTGTGIDWPPYSQDLKPCDFFSYGAT